MAGQSRVPGQRKESGEGGELYLYLLSGPVSQLVGPFRRGVGQGKGKGEG